MADVEAMYHQVQVLEDQQSFLKFLWWENHDINAEPDDYVMCALFLVQHRQPVVQITPCAGQLWKMKQFFWGSSSKCFSS